MSLSELSLEKTQDLIDTVSIAPQPPFRKPLPQNHILPPNSEASAYNLLPPGNGSLFSSDRTLSFSSPLLGPGQWGPITIAPTLQHLYTDKMK